MVHFSGTDKEGGLRNSWSGQRALVKKLKISIW